MTHLRLISVTLALVQGAAAGDGSTVCSQCMDLELDLPQRIRQRELRGERAALCVEGRTQEAR